jgi:hypothetical protein
VHHSAVTKQDPHAAASCTPVDAVVGGPAGAEPGLRAGLALSLLRLMSMLYRLRGALESERRSWVGSTMRPGRPTHTLAHALVYQRAWTFSGTQPSEAPESPASSIFEDGPVRLKRGKGERAFTSQRRRELASRLSRRLLPNTAPRHKGQ